ncbi:MAG: uroporphyrinogen-III C-methyltransferase [Betaproteobacteria bacterium]|nr:uroporphyrinogen-III C-methyltransferase [Betaproteobacteria bacterium]
MSGKVYLVGAGPGAPDLLTLRAARLLGQADIVFHDALVNLEILTLAVDAKLVPVGKRCGTHSTAQTFINKQLIDAAKKYRVIVRLKGGDPMLFGRAQEEIDALAAAGIDVEVVPGITAALAASASLKVSLTRRGIARNVAFVTPRIGKMERESDWIASAVAADTAVVYMGAGEAGAIALALIERGRAASTPIALVESASLPSEQWRYGTLRELGALAQNLGTGPAIIVLGDVLREHARAESRVRELLHKSG